MLKESKLYKNYITNEDGTYIENKLTKNILKPYISNSGYLYAAGIPVHRIVASAFNYDKYFDKATVDHIDGNKLNNHISNLEWVTQGENEKRSYENGRIGYWNGRKGEYLIEAKLIQSEKMSGYKNPSAKCRTIICDDGEIILCKTRNEMINFIENKYGIKYSMSYIKCLIRSKRDKKLGFNIIEGQSTIETTTNVDKGVE